MKPAHLILLTAFYALTACSPDTRQVFPDEFRPYVEAFFEDAQARGHDLHLEDYDLTISLRDLDTDDWIAYCRNLNRHKIRIDETSWERMSDQQKKRLMYHELGHCILDLPHRSFKSETGLCYSIMNDSRELACYQDFYSTHWWKYYVDELFDPSLTPEEYQHQRPLLEVALEDRLTIVDFRDSTFEERFNYFEELIGTAPAGNFSFTVKKTPAENGRTGFSIQVGSLRLQYCDCTASTVSISGSDGQNQESYYESQDPFEAPVTLTIQKEGDLLYFYANGKYVHSVEYGVVGERLEFNLSTGRRLNDTAPSPSFDVEIYAW